MEVSIAELLAELKERSLQVDEAIEELRIANLDAKEKSHQYKLDHARAYLEVVADLSARGKKTTVDLIKAVVDTRVADQHFSAAIAEGLRETALEALRSRRAQLSATQTVANLVKEEISLSRTGGDY